MSNPRDLSINIKAVSNPQHVLNGGPAGATFPGWFITVQQNEGYDTILGPEQLIPDEVLYIANEIDRVIDGAYSRWHITNAARRCSEAMKQELERQLEAAEKQAAKIPNLRKRLGLPSE